MLIHLESLQNTQNGDEPGVVYGVSSQTVVITDTFLGGDLGGGNHWVGIIGWNSNSHFVPRPQRRFAPGRRPRLNNRYFLVLLTVDNYTILIGKSTAKS